MVTNWKENYPRRGNEGSPGGESPSDWYRRKIDEITLHEQFIDLWDKQSGRRQPQAAQQQPAPWEGISQVAQSLGINLGELWRTREEELKGARDAADATSRELHELRLREIDRRVQELQTLADKVQQGVQTKPQESKGFLEQLEEITQGMISQRLSKLLDGGSTQQIVDPVDEIINRLDQAEKLKQRFGGAGSGIQSMAQSGNIRSELVELLLKDDRERLVMQLGHDAQINRNKYLGELLQTVQDGIQAFALSRGGKGTAGKPEVPQPQQYECGQCHLTFILPNTPFEAINCPNPQCGRTYTKAEIESARQK